jgi:hypothetical protein
MATITIAGSCHVVTSEVTMADLELVKKHRPKALKIVDEESKEELFAVGIGGNSLSDYGVSFGGVSNDELKLASVTLPIPPDTEDAQAYVAEKAGVAVVNLNRIEAGIDDVLAEIRAEHKKVTDSIKVVV